MEVTLVAHTALAVEGLSDTPMEGGNYEFSVDPVIERYKNVGSDSEEADALAEFAGRSCYQSFHKPNEKTAANEDYLANILSLGHESVLEHASVTFYITDVSRSLTHELIRHRHLSFSELSQRFVNAGENVGWVYPPASRDNDGAEDVLLESVDQAREGYEMLMEEFYYLPRKQAREAARAVLPNATETRIVVTGNMRAWRDVLKKRYSVHADAEIRELATELLRQLRGIAPATFQDFPEHPFE